jgi:succinyl-CoA synthetase beta subunit
MSIEDVAHSNPEKVHKLRVNILKGLQEADCVKAAKDLGLEAYTA